MTLGCVALLIGTAACLCVLARLRALLLVIWVLACFPRPAFTAVRAVHCHAYLPHHREHDRELSRRQRLNRGHNAPNRSRLSSRVKFSNGGATATVHIEEMLILAFFLHSSSCAYFDRPHSPTTDKYCTVRCLLSLSLSVHVRSPVGPLSLSICSMGGAVRSTAWSA